MENNLITDIITRHNVRIVSGEGAGQGHISYPSTLKTARSLKYRLIAERCNGDRWAFAEYRNGDNWVRFLG